MRLTTRGIICITCHIFQLLSTVWGLHNMADILQTTLWIEFCLKKMRILSGILLEFVPKGLKKLIAFQRHKRYR